MTPAEATVDRLARARLWNGLRLLVLDIETAVGPEGQHRIVSIAAVTCRAGRQTGRWSRDFVNPGVPIDSVTGSVHLLTDADVKNAPSFAMIASDLAPLLRALPGETLVVVAHIATFDVPVLRAELERAGATMPDLPVLDTARGLAPLAGIEPRGRSLEALLDACGVTNAAPHTAIGDAEATAKAACLLLDRAADAGHDHLARLLATLEAGRTTTLGFSRPGGRSHVATRPDLPAAHVAEHAHTLPRRPGTRVLARWLAAVSECAALGCDYLADRIAIAEAPTEILLPPLLDRLRLLANESNPAAVATVLGAILPRFVGLPPATRGQRNQAFRTAALDLDDALGPVLDGVPRCHGAKVCPACRVGQSCPVDVWRLALAPVALGGEVADRAEGFFETTGRNAGTGAYAEMCRLGHRRLADAALRLVHRHWAEAGQNDRAEALAAQAVAGGCSDPEIAGAHAVALAEGGREADLRAGLAVCDQALGSSDGSTDDAWRALLVHQMRIAGRLRRVRGRDSGTFDADGNPIPVRRHHPTNPRRSRPTRFLRTA